MASWVAWRAAGLICSDERPWRRHPRRLQPPAATLKTGRKNLTKNTAATVFLAAHGVIYGEHPYTYEAHGGTAVSARELGVAEHAVIKTLVMEDERGRPLLVLMHGDCTVSTKNLARQIGAKQVVPCKPEVATRHSGYLIGGTSPFGTRKVMPVYAERGIFALPRIYINGGRRGFLVSLAPHDLKLVLNIVEVEAGLKI